ncbi:MAG TPA: hypothetical protein VLA67_11900 [Nitrospiraceae bacterium]|nr:hypothetical protein [Nitrospiraceae bacterium]
MKFFSQLTHTMTMVMLPVLGCAFVACSALDRTQALPLEPIPVTDLKVVAGTWEGIMVQSPPTRSDDWITLRIQGDGTYHFEMVRTIGVFKGSGRFFLEDGKLEAKSETGWASAQLHRHVGMDDMVLKVEGSASHGVTYRAQLTPKRL